MGRKSLEEILEGLERGSHFDTSVYEIVTEPEEDYNEHTAESIDSAVKDGLYKNYKFLRMVLSYITPDKTILLCEKVYEGGVMREKCITK